MYKKVMYLLASGLTVVLLLTLSNEIYTAKEKEVERDLLTTNDELYIYALQTKKVENELFIYNLSSYKHNLFFQTSEAEVLGKEEKWKEELKRVEKQSEEALTTAHKASVPKEMKFVHDAWKTWLESLHANTMSNLENANKGNLISQEKHKEELKKIEMLKEVYEHKYNQAIQLKSKAAALSSDELLEGQIYEVYVSEINLKTNVIYLSLIEHIGREDKDGEVTTVREFKEWQEEFKNMIDSMNGEIEKVKELSAPKYHQKSLEKLKNYYMTMEQLVNDLVLMIDEEDEEAFARVKLSADKLVDRMQSYEESLSRETSVVENSEYN